VLWWYVEASGSVEDTEQCSKRTSVGICVVANKSPVLINLAVFLTTPLDIYGVDGGWVSGECLLVGDLVLIMEIKPEIVGYECSWFSIEVVEDGAFVGVRGVLAVFGET
jgi:hypothetical protein